MNLANLTAVIFTSLIVGVAEPQVQAGLFKTDTFEFERPQNWGIQREGEAFLVLQTSSDAVLNSAGQSVVVRGAMIGQLNDRNMHGDAKKFVEAVYGPAGYRQAGS